MGSPASHLKYQWLGFIIWIAATTWLLCRIIPELPQSDAVWVFIASAACAFFCSDFLSGIVHWVFDRYGTENIPVLGPGIIKSFRDHHTNPQGICGHNFIETNGDTSIACLPLLAVGLLLDPTHQLFWVCLLFNTSIGGFLTNQFHSWAHEENPPKTAIFLQKIGLILDPKHHKKHHSGEFDSNYCITNGKMNPILERTRILQRFERIFPPTVKDITHTLKWCSNTLYRF